MHGKKSLKKISRHQAAFHTQYKSGAFPQAKDTIAQQAAPTKKSSKQMQDRTGTLQKGDADKIQL